MMARVKQPLADEKPKKKTTKSKPDTMPKAAAKGATKAKATRGGDKKKKGTHDHDFSPTTLP